MKLKNEHTLLEDQVERLKDRDAAKVKAFRLLLSSFEQPSSAASPRKPNSRSREEDPSLDSNSVNRSANP